MRYSNAATLDAIVTTIPKNNLPLPTKTGRHLCTVQDLLSWLLRGVIQPDCFNRAGIKDGNTFVAIADDETVRKVRDNLLPLSLQDCHATLNPGKTAVTMTDFHGRGMGLMQRWWYGKMTAEDLKAEACLFVKPHDYHAIDYRTINDHAGHSASQRIWHPQYAYGSFIQNNLMPALHVDTANWLHKHHNRGTMLANILYALNKGRRNTSSWNLPDIYGMRTDAAKLRDVQTTVKIKETDIFDLASSIDNWHELLRILHTNAPGVGSIKDVTGNPFFGLYIVDCLSQEQERELNKSNLILSKQIIRNIGELAVICPQMLAPKKSTVSKNCDQVFRILRKKHRHAFSN